MAIPQILNSAIGDVDITARDTVGTLRFENGKWYKYVKLANVTAAVTGVSGDPVAYKAATGVASSIIVTDLTDADIIVIPAGFLTGTVTGSLTIPQWTWIQLTGLVTVPTAVTSGAQGKKVFLSTTDKTLTVGANAYDADMGVSVDTTGANNRVLANCRF